MPFQPVGNPRLYQQVANQIDGLIRRGEFPVGYRLPPERDLAKMLEVSRPMVREAMVALEIAGLIEVRSGSGTFVKATVKQRPLLSVFNLGDIGPSPFDVISARILIEGEIAHLAAIKASAKDISEIAGLHEKMHEHKTRRESHYETDRKFHIRIAGATGNMVLASIVEGLWDHQYALAFKVLSKRTQLLENRDATLSDHLRIIDALRRHDANEARDAVRAHLSQVVNVLLREETEV
jgi:DNA-binding FadR family transcriptional regulator